MKLDWGLGDINLPQKGESVSAESLSVLREWIDKVAADALIVQPEFVSGKAQCEKLILRGLIINAVLGYLAIAQKAHE